MIEDDIADRVAVALTEALLNGIQHGGMELSARLRQDNATCYRTTEFRRRPYPYRDRLLRVMVRLARWEVFAPSATRGRRSIPPGCPNRTTRPHLERVSELGLFQIRG